MQEIDRQIQNIDNIICANIDLVDMAEITRAFVSQNFLAHSRNLVEHIMVKAYGEGQDIRVDWDSIRASETYVKHDSKYLFIRKFHRFLQESKSHYTPYDDGAERLMLKYYEHFIMLRDFVKKEFGLEILHNLEKFPVNMDQAVVGYYRAVSEVLAKNYGYIDFGRSDRIYVMKSRPVIIDSKVVYENTLILANDFASKFDRFIAFSKFMVPDHYAIRADVRQEQIYINECAMPVQVLVDYTVSIRPCELDNLAKIFGKRIKMTQSLAEYQGLMKYLTKTGGSLTDIISGDQITYESIKTNALRNAKTTKFFDVLDDAREIVQNGKSGKNLVKYLTCIMRNKVIKDQYASEANTKLSGLYIQYGSIPFEEMPFCTSLIGHNPETSDVVECISTEGNEFQLLSKYIQNNTSVNGKLYTKRDEVEYLGDLDQLIKRFNSKLYYKHTSRKIASFGKNYLYIKENFDDTKYIIENMLELSKEGLGGYYNYVNSWMSENPALVNCDEKKKILTEMFGKSKISLIYGAAGTGKSYLLNHVAQLFDSRKKILLANTNPAVDNLQRKIVSQNCDFYTIAKFLSYKNENVNCDVLIIDECSMVGNSDMRSILSKANFKLLVLVGDIYQIESITFGNWFSLARYFLPKYTWNELTTPYRAQNGELLELWTKVRNIEEDITEHMVAYQYSMSLDESIFTRQSEDEIILCLNYNGLYGINNINRFLQNNNPAHSEHWGMWDYKIGDPVLFNESKRFAPVIYNNLKGKIVDINIDREENKIWFSVEIDKVITEMDIWDMDLELLNPDDVGNSVIKFGVRGTEDGESDGDNDGDSETIIPFQIAYAVSIHKAQGLEYDSVKVIITEDIDEMISHNIFYTAITRARNNLKVYWSPESQQRVISRFGKTNLLNDVNIFAGHSKLKILNRNIGC